MQGGRGTIKRLVLLFLFISLVGCGSGGGDANNQGGQTVSPPPVENSGGQTNPQAAENPQDNVTVSGTVTYDRVPFEGKSYTGLDYDNMLVSPARGFTVQALDRSGQVVASTQTDAAGTYTFVVDRSQDIKIRIVAELSSADGSQWSIQVKDNTNGNALYVLDGSYASLGERDTQTRDLHAASGWVSNAYTEERSAGPFAILDSIYDALMLVIEAEPDVVLPPLDVFWSPNNISVNGNISIGHIGTSFYSGNGPSIYLLGAEDNDSDEYDRGVVQHEFGHYLEHQISRSESIGGSHSLYSKLDIRVAFGEAWGNAFAGMAGNDPIYRDSLGNQQGYGFIIDVQSNTPYNKGWFSEASIQSILFDLFDDDNESGDNIALGFKPIYDVLTSGDYLDFAGFASIYPFVDLLKQQQPEKVTEIAALLNAQKIFGTGMYGEDESYDANTDILLPVYTGMAVGDTVNVCSNSNFQSYNGVDIRRFVKLDITEAGRYQFSVTRAGGEVSATKPRMNIYQSGNYVGGSNSASTNSLTSTRSLDTGTYILEIYEAGNTDSSSSTGGLACFDVRVY